MSNPMSGTEDYKGLNWLGSKSQRWHFDWEGKRFILYAESKEKAEEAICQFVMRGHTVQAGGSILIPNAIPSGHYDYATNTIIGAQDGPHTIEDGRKVF